MRKTLVLLLLAGGLVAPELIITGPHDAFTPEQREMFDRMQIGERVEIRVGSGSCNTCGEIYLKVSENEVALVGNTGCTLRHCPADFPVERFK